MIKRAPVRIKSEVSRFCNHPCDILTAVRFKLFPQHSAFRLRHVAAVNAQVFEAGLRAFLNFQMSVATTGQRLENTAFMLALPRSFSIVQMALKVAWRSRAQRCL